jgi:hypothetical protein
MANYQFLDFNWIVKLTYVNILFQADCPNPASENPDRPPR